MAWPEPYGVLSTPESRLKVIITAKLAQLDEYEREYLLKVASLAEAATNNEPPFQKGAQRYENKFIRMRLTAHTEPPSPYFRITELGYAVIEVLKRAKQR